MSTPELDGGRPLGTGRRRVLNIGSGEKRRDDAVNIDRVAETLPDVVHDLNSRPWPLADDHFHEVLAFDVIEHLEDIVGTMEEIHRVCADGAKVRITVPHFSCANAFTDPTHRHYFGWFSFHYFTGEHAFSYYTTRRFRRTRTQLVFQISLLNRLIWRLANRYPHRYEQRWTWLFPAWYLYFELEVVKSRDPGSTGKI